MGSQLNMQNQSQKQELNPKEVMQKALAKAKKINTKVEMQEGKEIREEAKQERKVKLKIGVIKEKGGNGKQ